MTNQIQRDYKGSLRLPDYDYSQNGAYFVTLVTFQRNHLFGKVNDGRIILNEIGMVVKRVWQDIPLHFSNVIVDKFVIMPNHLHGIVVIENEQDTTVDATHASHLRQEKGHCSIQEDAPLEPIPGCISRGPAPGSLGAIIGSFKSAASRRIHHINGYQECKVWQRNYYEHVLRDEEELQRLADYIDFNPMNWTDDAILSSL